MSFQSLMDALNGLSELHEALLTLAREKERIIVENRVDELMALTSKEMKMISRVDGLYAQLTLATSGHWEGLGLGSRASVTLEELIQAVHVAHEKDALTEAGLHLRSRIDELRAIHQRNQLLVSHSLEYIRFELELLTAPFDQELTYNPGRTTHTGTPMRSFDTRG